MKKIYLVAAAVLILVSAVFISLYFFKGGSGQNKLQGKSSSGGEISQPVVDHQAHSQGKEQPQGGSEATPVQAPAQEAPTVEIPLEKQQLIGVKTVEVSARSLQKTIRTVGRIEYDERRLATINTKFEGWIEKLYVDYTGKYVKQGEPLAAIYSPELFATQQEFLNTLKWGGEKKTEYWDATVGEMLVRDATMIRDAAKQRLRLWDISDAQIKTIEESGKPIRTLMLYSPVNGYVVQKMAIQGMKVMPGEKLFDIADMSSLWIIADIYEYELSLLKVGQTAKLSLSSFPGKEFSSRIDYVYPTLTGETRTAKVRFTIPNPGGLLKPQMFANVEVKILIGKKLAIPDDAIIDTGTRQIVYVDKGEGLFEPREVMLGIRAEGFREVLMGLKAGEKIAASATFLIDSEAQLKGVTPLGGHKH
jgi:Cu(I)/Ag(I) efflux system membrane fusion protein